MTAAVNDEPLYSKLAFRWLGRLTGIGVFVWMVLTKNTETEYLLIVVGLLFSADVMLKKKFTISVKADEENQKADEESR